MYVVVASATKAPQGARSPYKRVAVLEVVPGTVPKRIAVGRGVLQIVRTWERLHVGGARSAYARARADAEALAAELNARAGVGAARANPNWQLNVHSDRALLASNGPYVTQRAALVDAKELARRRASAQDQRVKTMRTRAGRDAGYKVVDLGGNPTGFFVMPVADKGAELRYNPKRHTARSARANHHLAPGQRAAGEVRVIKSLGMKGKADYYIVEGHRLRAEGARKNSGKAQVKVQVTEAEARAHMQRHAAEALRYARMTTHTGSKNVHHWEQSAELSHRVAEGLWHDAATLLGRAAWGTGAPTAKQLSAAVRKAQAASARAAETDAGFLAIREEVERLKARIAARSGGAQSGNACREEFVHLAARSAERQNSGKPRHSWGKLLNKWHDEQSLFHLLKPDGAPACGASYYASTGPYPYAEEDCYPRCAKCDKRAKRSR